MTALDRILELLAREPGLKAQQIAEKLDLPRADVAQILHGAGAAVVSQDSDYRWRLEGAEMTAPPVAPRSRTLLTRLCHYYVECLGRESGSGVSLSTADPGGFAPLAELPFVHAGDWSLRRLDRAARRVLQKVRKERGQLALYIGYGLRVRRWLNARHDEEAETRIEPVLLYPLDDTSLPDALRPVSGIPLFNLEVLKSLAAVDSGNLLDEAIQLAEELGLANPEVDLPEWDEIILRLAQCRPEWNWAEPLQPYALTAEPALEQITEPGIYNRALLFAATRSPFTYGLETELRRLAQLEEAALEGTALAGWVNGFAPPGDSGGEDRAPELLEVLPLNGEQRQAVVQGLTAPLTVVTGPPGTGKSQVVASLLINMAWQGRSVLFSSKNNHAVDVVESRVNSLGVWPLLLRLGKPEHHARIAQHLTAGLAESPRPGDVERLAALAVERAADHRRRGEAQEALAAVVALRNHVDRAERAAEPARTLLGERGFRQVSGADLEGASRRLDELAALLEAAQPAGQPAVVRWVWDAVKRRRFERIAEVTPGLVDDAALPGVPLPKSPPGEETLPAWLECWRALSERLEAAKTAQAYWQPLARLRSARAMEETICDLGRVEEQAALHAREFWQCWLRLWPSRWADDERKLLSEYVSLLQILAGGDRSDETSGRNVYRRYYSLFPRVARTLPCWAVTSLSARGRLPFTPALFDLAIIDEASQCDIASALPLLYRARRAVIIGDPLQLRHVSTVSPREDRLSLSSHGLADGHATWAYSVNSLFDMARSVCRLDDLVNLRDHHRSHRDIIAFSNEHFYRGGLRIATDHDALVRPEDAAQPAVRWIDVRGKVIRPAQGGAVNPVEAEAVVGEIRRLIVEQGFTGAIGAVTPFRAQANRIRALVHQHPDLAQRLAPAQFVVDTVHGFQGDERDVMFFSPVVSAGTGEHTLRFPRSHGNLFNVAITRARSELIVVGDRQAALDSGVEYLAGFAAYARDLAPPPAPPPAGELGPEYPPVAQPELVSEWERVFYRALYRAGLRPVPQYPEPPDILDFALFAPDGRRLDIEIDGEYYHRSWDGELSRRDQIRSRRLSDLGWDVQRFWVYEIRDDLEASVERVKRWWNDDVHSSPFPC